MQFVGKFVPPFTHCVRIVLPPFELVDVEKIEERQRRDKVFKPGECRDFHADSKFHLLCVLCRSDKIGIKYRWPAFVRWVKPDFVDKSLKPGKLGVGRSFC